MVEVHLGRRGIEDPRLLEAFTAVPREEFVADDLRELAYADRALPIDAEQTISQPYVVAVMLQYLELRGTERLLDVGTGSGYAAAIASLLVPEVISIERIAELATSARARLDRLGFRVTVVHGDGTLGWPPRAPYDAIVVGAGGPRIPPALVEQLAPGGCLVLPVRVDGHHMLHRVTRAADGSVTDEALEPVVFVPLIGAQGEPDPAAH